MRHSIQYIVRCLILQIEQCGLLPALDRDAADANEHSVKEYADKHSLSATAIVM
jgi:hypothetical protein